MVLALLRALIIMGLHVKKHWGWVLNITMLSVHTAGLIAWYYSYRYLDMWNRYGETPSSTYKIVWMSIWSVFFLLLFLAQYSYWKKRRHLFN
jgi:hypothetical protein